MTPCRICTANDEDALIEDIAAAVWESTKGEEGRDVLWAEASEQWRRTYRRHARAMAAVVRKGHGHG